MSADAFKKAAAEKAAKLVAPDMTIGLGTGSTAAHLVAALGARVRDGLEIKAIPTSKDTEDKARAAGIDIIIPDETTEIDIAIDGADEIGQSLTLIKGGGGALLREKIVADAARRFIVIADSSKVVRTLGAFPLPVEIEPFGWALTVRRLRDALSAHGYTDVDVSLRSDNHGNSFLSDGGNYITDCALNAIDEPARLNDA
ncbi:MAG: ribose-5-phosphate isomerase RpiA, partial [Pseudomonadota bacterium]